MDHRTAERSMARMVELQPRVPQWCKAEHMETIVPQMELWRYETYRPETIMSRIGKRIFGRAKRREATP